MKYKKIVLTSLLLSFTTIASLPIAINVTTKANFVASSNSFNKENNDVLQDANDQNKIAQPVPFDFDVNVPLISETTGPIVSRKNSIYSLDWFGAKRWEIDLSVATFNGKSVLPNGVTADKNSYLQWYDKVFINYTLDNKNHILYVLTNTVRTPSSSGVSSQNLVAIDTISGRITGCWDLKNEVNNLYEAMYSISVLENGNVFIYNDGSNRWWRSQIFDVKTGEATRPFESQDKKAFQDTIDQFNRENPVRTPQTRTSYTFPVGKNKNVMIMTNLGNDQSDYGSENSLWITYVDDKLQRIIKTEGDSQSKPILIQNRNKMSTSVNLSGGSYYPKLTYTLADGRILFAAYDKLYIFFPNEIETTGRLVYKEIQVNNDDGTGKNLPIQSWSTDTDNNIYIKYAGSGVINKVKITGSTSQNTTTETSTYFNLDGVDTTTVANEKIKNNATTFVLYNVYGYSGQIMLLKPYPIIDKKNIEKTIAYDETNYYGLSAAIVNNTQSPGNGDLKGLLNTEHAFLKSADFNLENTILTNKLPSEISRNDLKLENGAFFTRNPETNPDGSPKYPQFTKEVINDKTQHDPALGNGNLRITAHLDQIPWFVDNGIMPGNIAPLKITKTYLTTNLIDKRVSWKNVDLDYDFKNTLPSKITQEDIDRFDPFSINIVSQNTSINGVRYPNKKYSLSEPNDNNGTIKVSAIFEYLPVDVEAKQSNLKTETFTQTFKVFSSDGQPSFNFVGNNGNNQEDISTIPQLKELSESNLLPSSINANDPSTILRFINTDNSKGYPISKMSFQITPNDANGTLTISGRLPDNYYPNQGNNVYSKTYTGLNKLSDYSLNINSNTSSFNKKNFRPSEINEQILYSNFIQYKGFNSSDITLELIPNDQIGELSIRLILNGTYPNVVASAWGFTRENNYYVKNDKISGFKTTEEYQNQYSVNFIDDNSQYMREIKKYTPNQIKDILKNSNTGNGNNLTINGTPIRSEEDLAKNVIQLAGSSIPKELNQTNFAHEIYYNDPNGELTVKLTFKNVPGAQTDLVFIQRYTGFAKGNQVPTEDIFSFKTQSQLFADHSGFKEMFGSQLKKELENTTTQIDTLNKFIGFSSSAYASGIQQKKFKLEVIVDDIYGYLTLKITFEKEVVTNPQSLLSYTATYSGFLTE